MSDDDELDTPPPPTIRSHNPSKLDFAIERLAPLINAEADELPQDSDPIQDGFDKLAALVERATARIEHQNDALMLASLNAEYPHPAIQDVLDRLEGPQLEGARIVLLVASGMSLDDATTEVTGATP